MCLKVFKISFNDTFYSVNFFFLNCIFKRLFFNQEKNSLFKCPYLRLLQSDTQIVIYFIFLQGFFYIFFPMWLIKWRDSQVCVFSFQI